MLINKKNNFNNINLDVDYKYGKQNMWEIKSLK